MIAGSLSLASSAEDAAESISVCVTISDEGRLVMARKWVKVYDLDGDGTFTVDETLVAAHNAGYDGGAIAGYAVAETGYGLGITKLWGNGSGSYGYWLNNASCWSLSDAVKNADRLVAFTYKSLDPWDTYTKFDSNVYLQFTNEEFKVKVDAAGYDADWNTVFAPHVGAKIKILEQDLTELSADKYIVADNGDGTYTLKVFAPGEYILASFDDSLPAVPAVAALAVDKTEYDPYGIFSATGDYMETLGAPSVGTVGGEWMVIGLARAGRECPDGYYKNVERYVKVNINDDGQLHRSKSTENSRVILALTAAGYDVTDVAGHDLLIGLSDMSYVKKQGINGPVWALIALESHGYGIPQNDGAADQTTREGLISYVLGRETEGGGWSVSGSAEADADMTAMAVTALAPYYAENDAVKAAVDRALVFLSEMQNEIGRAHV